MKVSKNDLIKMVDKLSQSNYKVAWILKNAEGDFNKISEPHKFLITKELGIKIIKEVHKKFKLEDGTEISEEDYLMRVNNLGVNNHKVATLLRVANGNYYDIPSRQRGLIDKELGVEVTIRNSTRYEKIG
ncbi:hypothetical protein COF68_05520 [Bacillus toyonensis]|uniref:hypothetical protein n=1 Tax=Bacillus toyonensis TaxID=155322 RepID=UPI000BFE004D|nr:hypothetical protein [Bacillus toyonensis]PHE64302.1 hypothetical protein COF68_05520 [Bacillus toyonensis]